MLKQSAIRTRKRGLRGDGEGVPAELEMKQESADDLCREEEGADVDKQREIWMKRGAGGDGQQERKDDR